MARNDVSVRGERTYLTLMYEMALELIDGDVPANEAAYIARRAAAEAYATLARTIVEAERKRKELQDYFDGRVPDPRD